MMRTLKSFAVAGSLLFASAAQAQNLSGTATEWAPFTGSKLNSGGIVTDIVTQVFEQAGHDLSMKYLPWERALAESKAGKINVLVGAWYSEERAQNFYMSEPFLHNRIVFIKPKGNSFEFNGLDSLSGKKVGVIRGWAYSEEFNQASNFKKPDTGSLVNNLKKLSANRIDLTLSDEIVARYTLGNELPQMKDSFAFTSNALGEKGLHIAISRSNPQGQALIDAFNQSLAALKADGSYGNILKNHGL